MKANLMKLTPIFLAISILLSSCSDKLPQVETNPVQPLGNGMIVGGNVIDEGSGEVYQRGVCFSSSPDASLEESTYYTNDGTGAGEFSSEVPGLNQGYSYYAKAYAINQVGISYGKPVMFTYISVVPTIIDSNGDIIYIYPTNNSESKSWGPLSLTNAQNYYNGQANTALIDGFSGNYAAKICSDLTAYGSSDWYLPSRSELYEIGQKNYMLGNFKLYGDYWTSTEYSNNSAYIYSTTQGYYFIENKSNTNKCRCIRKN